TPNPVFDFSNSSTATGSATLNMSQDSGSAPVTAPTSGVDANRVLLGTFTFTGVSSGTALIQTADPHPTLADNVLHDGTVWDPVIVTPSAPIPATAVPEPSTLLLTGLAAGGGGLASFRRWRRRGAAVVC